MEGAATPGGANDEPSVVGAAIFPEDGEEVVGKVRRDGIVAFQGWTVGNECLVK